MLCPCPLLDLFSKGTWEKEMSQSREAQAFLRGFVLQGDSMRNMDARCHGAGVWAQHKDKLKSSSGD